MTKKYQSLEEMFAASAARPVQHGCAKFFLLVMSPKGVMMQESQASIDVLKDESGAAGSGDDFALSVLAHLYSGVKDIL